MVQGVGEVRSPGKWHHAVQAKCDCIVSEFRQSTDEDQQVTPQTLLVAVAPA